jgi:hypothetical protein
MNIPKPRFLRSTPQGGVLFDRSGLEAPLPLSLSDVRGDTSSHISYGTYFEAIERALETNIDRLKAALRKPGLREIKEIREIDLIAEKHGSDYHPARVLVRTGTDQYSFVMNVAVTDRGRMRAKNEFQLLRRISDAYPAGYTPGTYFMAEDTGSHGADQDGSMVMFLGEWFEGYHEFHLSMNSKTAAPRIVVWHSERGNILLSDAEAEEIYRQAAFILTHYFDTETYGEVFPWHHAAGDFVVSESGGKIDVKLITVRQYQARSEFPEKSDDDWSTALLLFLANLTVRMRLDRLDGVGETVWAPDHCVRATFRGFMDAMRQKADSGVFESGRLERFNGILKSLSPADLAELFTAVLDSYDREAPDIPVIGENLADHVLAVYRTIQNISLDRAAPVDEHEANS